MSTNRQPRKIIAGLHVVAFAFWQLSVSRFVYLSRVITIINLRRGNRCHYSRLRLAYFGLRIVSERLRWSRGSVLAFSTQVRGFKPGRSRRIFKGEKILSTPSFGGEVKPSVPCRRFAACKRSLNGVEVVIWAKLPDNILAYSSAFHH